MWRRPPIAFRIYCRRCKSVDGVDNVKVIGNIIHVICDSKTKADVILAIEKGGGNITNFHTMEPSLEEVFMRYTGDQK